MAADASLLPQLPFASFEYVTVDFADYNTATRVPHGLTPQDPYAVRYIPMFKTRECVISDARTEDGAHTEPWTRDYIVLQSSLAPVQVEFLLVIPRRRPV